MMLMILDLIGRYFSHNLDKLDLTQIT